MLHSLILLTLAAMSYQQLFDLHPAAGPQFFPEENMVQVALDGHGIGFNSEKKLKGQEEFYQKEVDMLIDPEGKPIDEPQKAYAMVIEEELRREASEIQRILSGQTEESTNKVSLETWVYTLIGCGLVVSCGVVPAFLLPTNTHEFFASIEGQRKLNLLLSFAVGSLLGDVFLHLLPESFAANGGDHRNIGMWVLAGLFMFFFVEKLGASSEEGQHQLCALMNLAANVVDNFAHGLAVGGSFLVSPKFGVMTTLTILIHELPHEVSDFAILLRADYDRADAMKAQFVTASAGVAGAVGALWLHTSEFAVVDVLLPFTAGGFLNIALTQILPELNEEQSPVHNFKQLVMISSGVLSMSVLNMLTF